MPKETIQDQAGQYDVRVGWRQDGEVQVGVEQAAGFSLVSVLYGDPKCMERIGTEVARQIGAAEPQTSDAAASWGRAILNIVEASQPVPGSPSYTGVWSTLNREGCNRLIKTVRRARDAAFGRDE